MRPTDLLCLACEFRVAMNEHSGMTTGRKFQYLHWYGLLSLPMTLMYNSSFARAQLLETWLTYACWHVTWNSWIFSIETVGKCLFNTRFFSYYFHLCLLRNSKFLFARAQRREVCDPLISCVWHVTFGWLSTNNPTWLQDVSRSEEHTSELQSR